MAVRDALFGTCGSPAVPLSSAPLLSDTPPQGCRCIPCALALGVGTNQNILSGSSWPTTP